MASFSVPRLWCCRVIESRHNPTGPCPSMKFSPQGCWYRWSLNYLAFWAIFDETCVLFSLQTCPCSYSLHHAAFSEGGPLKGTAEEFEVKTPVVAITFDEHSTGGAVGSIDVDGAVGTWVPEADVITPHQVLLHAAAEGGSGSPLDPVMALHTDVVAGDGGGDVKASSLDPVSTLEVGGASDGHGGGDQSLQGFGATVIVGDVENVPAPPLDSVTVPKVDGAGADCGHPQFRRVGVAVDGDVGLSGGDTQLHQVGNGTTVRFSLFCLEPE